MKRLMILLAVLMIASVSFGENGPSPLVTPGSVSGLGTMAVVNSPVPVANGGTGATTAAAGLAALGGASLKGSSTVAFEALSLNGISLLTTYSDTVPHTASLTVNISTLGASGLVIMQQWRNGNEGSWTAATYLLSGFLGSMTLTEIKSAVHGPGATFTPSVSDGAIHLTNAAGVTCRARIIFIGRSKL